MFIVHLNVADALTLTGHALVWTGIWLTLAGNVPLAISALTLAMLVDALDGMVARRLGIARPFGRFLGSLVDLVNYTVAPPLVLFKMGYVGPLPTALLWLYSTCGMLRLARFNEVGNIEHEGRLAYLGLPVFWVHFVLMALYGSQALAPRWAFEGLTSIALAALSFCFLHDRPFWKPQDYRAITVVTLAAAALFAWLGLRS